MESREFLSIYAGVSALNERKAAELFGDKEDLPEDELEIVFDRHLSHDEKLCRLQVVRASKQVKPKSFAKRITRAGRIHAQALGIKL
jgi:hypothetical protein